MLRTVSIDDLIDPTTEKCYCLTYLIIIQIIQDHINVPLKTNFKSLFLSLETSFEMYMHGRHRQIDIQVPKFDVYITISYTTGREYRRQ